MNTQQPLQTRSTTPQSAREDRDVEKDERKDGSFVTHRHSHLQSREGAGDWLCQCAGRSGLVYQTSERFFFSEMKLIVHPPFQAFVDHLRTDLLLLQGGERGDQWVLAQKQIW